MQAHDALRALDAVGVADERRVRSVLRLVCCGTREETVAFDRAFDAFFWPAATGADQPAHAPRRTRPGPQTAPPDPAQPLRGVPPPIDAPEGAASRGERRPDDAREPDAAAAWHRVRARYSPVAGSLPAPALADEQRAAMRSAARRVIAALRLGRSRRLKPTHRGRRFDVRRTIRASLQTGGDPAELRFLGRPPRNPRFVVLIDASRSIVEQTGPIVEFARALCAASSRTNVFFFSTELHEVTRELRAATDAGTRLDGLGAAWGGGTKIGVNLNAFIESHGQLMSQDTLIMIFSDGLDGGDVAQLDAALGRIDRGCAGIVWLNPHAASPGYQPTARAMRVALPHLALLAAANDAADFALLAQRLARNPRIVRRFP